MNSFQYTFFVNTINMHFRHCRTIYCVQIPLHHSIFGLRSSEKFQNLVYLVIVDILHLKWHNDVNQDTSCNFITVHQVAPIRDISKYDKGIHEIHYLLNKFGTILYIFSCSLFKIFYPFGVNGTNKCYITNCLTMSSHIFITMI